MTSTGASLVHAHRKVGVTTTSVLDGWEVNEYLGPVVAHTVAGTGLISDWFASWSDVFGGRSGSYQKQLRSLSDEAIAAVRAKAYDISANWVVGLTVDMDEISGQGKQMFMVTAMGTAVRATRALPPAPAGPAELTHPAGQFRERVEQQPLAASTTGSISNDVVQAATRRYVLLDRLNAGRLAFEDETWATLLREQIIDAAPAVIREYGRQLATGMSGSPEVEQFRKHAAAYFEQLPVGEAVAALYTALERTPDEARAAMTLIKDLKLRDLPTVRQLLAHPSDIVRRRAIQPLGAEQHSYSPEDVAHLEAIAACCTDETKFPPIATLIPATGKGFFSGKDRLSCMCKTERPADVEFCPNLDCRRDRLGFRAGSLTPAVAKEGCETLAATLRRVFAELGEPEGVLA